MITKCQAMLNLWQYGSNFNVKWVSLYPTIRWNGLILTSVARINLEKWIDFWQLLQTIRI